MTSTTHVQAPPQRSKKVRAILAGGIVLGIGAAVTLAAWNDSEFAEGIFTTGQFNLEGATAGTADDAFSDHPTEEAAAVMAFEADAMVPGEVVHAPFWVRLDSTTTVDGFVAEGDLRLVTSEGANVENLSYSVTQIAADATCNGTSSGTAVLAGETLTPNTEASGSTALDLSAGEGTAAGAPVQLCFAITAASDDSLEQGVPTAATWEVVATSDEA